MSQNQSVLDRPEIQEQVKEWIQAGETNASIVRKVSLHFEQTTSERSVARFRKRHELNPAGFDPDWVQVDGDRGEVQVTSEGILQDPDKMIRERGLDPAEWVIEGGMRVNQYEGPASAEHAEKTGESKVTYHQTRFSIVKRNPLHQIVAARTNGWRPPKKADRLKSVPRLVVIAGDQQAPFYDRGLHSCFLQFLGENRPHEGVSLGDSVDYPEPSRHPLDPDNTASINECNQSGYDMYRGYVNASPDTAWIKLPGNHDERIRNLILGKPSMHPLYGVKRAQPPETAEEPSVLNIDFLLRLDELGIKYIDPHGKYDLAEHTLSEKLAVRHGWIARQGSGASALETLKHTGYSIIIGHTHRQSMVLKTFYDINDYPKTLTAVETGCMCRLDTEVDKEDGRIWPNYSPLPDWQQGFATATIWPDGKFRLDLATYVNGILMWRDQRYTAVEEKIAA